MANASLNDLLKVLLREKIDFVLIGGFASVVHGCSYITQDLDICMALTSVDVAKLRHALTGLHAVHKSNPNVSLDDRPRDGEEMSNLYLRTDLGVLDVLSSVSPIGDFEVLKARAIATRIYGYECLVISLDDLIHVKESVGRKKDLLVLEELYELRNRMK